ncbi:MAG: hypothetical protein K0B01_04095 [Syntrophobacterales bacterium]|nr:hypothetical protein [Syntrophobacterales bacterium]
MIELTIPGFGQRRLLHLVSDYNGTLCVDGALIAQVAVKLNILDAICPRGGNT